MENLKLNDLSAEQRAALMDELKAKEKAEKERVKSERDTYKQLVSDTVNDLFPELVKASLELGALKKRVYMSFNDAIGMKVKLYDTDLEMQRSHAFINADGTRRITLGVHETDAYDDTVEAGISKVKAYIGSLAKDKESQMLVEAIMKLLARDQQGNLKASRVVQLQMMAERSGNEGFTDGVRIIREAFRPQRSKTYIRAERKDDTGAWESIPLGMTEAN
jgi:hypothetical protein